MATTTSKTKKDSFSLSITKLAEELTILKTSIIDNDLVDRYKELAQNVGKIEKSVISVANSVADMNNYISTTVANAGEFKPLIKLLQNLAGGLSKLQTVSEQFNSKKFEQSIINSILGIMSVLRYICQIVSRDSKPTLEGLDNLMGDTNAYQMLIGNGNIKFTGNTNNSILFRFFLLNKLIEKLMTSKSVKMTWWQRWKFFHITLKRTINNMFDAMMLFAKRAKVVSKTAMSIKEDGATIITNIMEVFVSFYSFVNFVNARAVGFFEKLRIKKNIRKFVSYFDYFLKQFKKVITKYRRVLKPEITEPMKDIVSSIHDMFENFDLSRRLSFFGIWKSIRKMKKCIKGLLNLPFKKLTPDKITKIQELASYINDANQVVSTMDSLINTGKNLQAETMKSIVKKATTIGQDIKTFINDLSLLTEHRGDIEKLSDDFVLVEGVFKNLLSIIGMSREIAWDRITMWLVDIVIKDLIKVINTVSIAGKEISKVSVRNVTKIEKIFKHLKEISISSWFIGLAAPAMLMAWGTTWLLRKVMKNLNQIRIGKNTMKNMRELPKILALLGFVMLEFIPVVVLANRFIDSTSLAPVFILCVNMAMVIGVFAGIQWILEKKANFKFKMRELIWDIALMGLVLAEFIAVVVLANRFIDSTSLAPLVPVFILCTSMAMVIGVFVGIQRILEKANFKSKMRELIWDIALMGLVLAEFTLVITLAGWLVNANALGAILGVSVMMFITGMFFWALCKMMDKMKYSDVLKTGITLLAISGVLIVFAASMRLTYGLIGGLTDWNAYAFLMANMIGVTTVFMTVGMLVNGQWTTLLAGIACMMAIAGCMAVIGLAMGKMYREINGLVDWEAFGFVMANIGAMIGLIALLGSLAVITGGIGAIVAVVGALMIMAVVAPMPIVGLCMGKMYREIKGLTDWKAFGFMVANVGAMILLVTLASAALTAPFGAIVIMLASAAFLVAALALNKIYNTIQGRSIDWKLLLFLAANVLSMVGIAALAAPLALPAAVGSVAIVFVSVAFAVASLSISIIYSLLGDKQIDWNLIGFLAANVLSMVGIAALVGFAALHAIIGSIAIVFVAGAMAAVGLGMFVLYKLISNITNWGVFGFAVANIVAFVGLAVMAGLICITGIGAVAIFAGLVVLVGISIAMVTIGIGMAVLYSVLGSIPFSWELLGMMVATVFALLALSVFAGVLQTLSMGVLEKGVIVITALIDGFIQIGEKMFQMFMNVPADPEVMAKKTQALLTPLDILSEWVKKQADVSSLKSIVKDLIASIIGSEKTLGLIGLLNALITAVNSLQTGKTQSFEHMISSLSTMASITPVNFNTIARDVDKIADSINGIDLDKTKAVADMFKHAAAFATAIHGNFDGLADTIRSKFVPVINALRIAIENADKHIVDYQKKVVEAEQQARMAEYEASKAQQKVPTIAGKQVDTNTLANNAQNAAIPPYTPQKSFSTSKNFGKTAVDILNNLLNETGGKGIPVVKVD